MSESGTTAISEARLTARARWAVPAVFAVHGAVSGSFAARVPWIQHHAGLTAGTLGVALITPGIGALATMPFAGRMVHRLGSRSATRLLITLWCAALVLPALAPNLPTLAASFLVFGATAGTADVAMNAQAVAIEARVGKSIMSGLHGLWSAGAMAGSGVGAFAAHANVDGRVHFAIAAAVLIAAGLFASRYLLPTSPIRGAALDDAPRFALPRGLVLIIGLVGFCAIVGESAGNDWCAVYLHTVAKADVGTAAAGFTAFAFTMAAGRIAGDFVIRRLGPVRTVRYSAVVGTIGSIVVVAARTPALGIAGFALLGMGIAVTVPLCYAAAGHAGDHPAHAIAGVATVSYGAGLGTPGLVGGIASATSLPSAFLFVTVAVAALIFGAKYLACAADVTRRDDVVAVGGTMPAPAVERA